MEVLDTIPEGVSLAFLHAICVYVVGQQGVDLRAAQVDPGSTQVRCHVLQMVGDGRAASFAAEGLVKPNSDPCGARGSNRRPTRMLAWTHSKKIADLFARRGTL